MYGLVLASRSPRRCELLSRLGIPFQTDAPDIDESCDLPAPDAVKRISFLKASAVSVFHPDDYILSADTLVSCNGKILGKPKDNADAAGMLRLLSGQTHQVYTGVTVVSPSGIIISDYDRTDVSFCTLSEDEILSYILSGEPIDKAGAYALQGKASVWIEHISGSDTSVIGLPLYLVRRLLNEVAFPVRL